MHQGKIHGVHLPMFLNPRQRIGQCGERRVENLEMRGQLVASGNLTLEEEVMPKECDCKAGGYVLLNSGQLQLHRQYPQYTRCEDSSTCCVTLSR